MVTESVVSFLESRQGDGDWSEVKQALAALSLTVAQRIDGGDVNPQLVRELRATLLELAPPEVNADAFDRIAAELSAAMGDSSD